ncbi:alpha/beta fold hydrolase [Aquabacterium humicola]|uniref:alpha/beta fold hydrolase n=1 Tax=Aquabacterium humicola TaxID=3237377 RepID=UPI002543278A|nr:alpha/beta hydrolase [Rubrivivax pictus]
MELTVQGRRAYAYTGGKAFDPALPTLVFLHGALHDHSIWTLLSRWFAHHGWSVLAVDEPGHARSEGPPLPDVEALADWTLALLDAAGVQQAALVGHSMGSLIALEAAGRAPERITRLVMIATAYPMKVSEALLSTARDAPLKAIEMVNNFSISSHASKPGYPAPGTWQHGANRALMRRVHGAQKDVNLFHHDFSVCDRYANGLQAAAKVACPVHFILGSADQMTNPKATRELAAALKARVHTLPSGHSLMQEQPDGVLNALRGALA